MRISPVAVVVSILFLRLSIFAQSANDTFDALAKEFLEGYFRANPITATQIGVHDHDHRLDEIGRESIDAEIRRLRDFRQQFSRINPASLSKDRRIDLRILIENIDETIFHMTELREHEWNPMVYTGALGNSIASLIHQDFAPIDGRLRNAALRAREVPRYLDQAKVSLARASKIHVETAIRQNQGNIGLFKDELLHAGKESSPEIQDALAEASAVAVAALEGFGKWLETDLLPRADKNPRIGKQLFEQKLAHTLKSDLSARQVLERAEAEKTRIHREMFSLAAPLYREYYGEEVTGMKQLTIIKAVLDKIVLDHPSKEELVNVIRSIIPETERFVTEHDLLSLDPTQPLVIRETPEYQRGVAVASLEAPGPLEKNLKTFYNVTPIPDEWTPEQVESYLREYNIYSLHDLSIHEAIPGHYVQLYYANRNPSMIRSVFGSGPMIEGWAVYAERMMVDQGYMNNDPRMKLINMKWYIRVVINAIIDQKIHAGTMNEQEAMDLMMKEGFQEEREAAGKWRRANLTSAQLSTYFVGFQEIWNLREEYKKKMGPQFSLKEFHETFLSFGSPPVKYIREIMLSK